LTITSNRGSQFISDFIDKLLILTRIKLKLSIIEYIQTNGQIEIVNQIINTHLRLFVNHFQNNWTDLLLILDITGTAYLHKSTGLSPLIVNYNYKPYLDFDWILAASKFRISREKLNRQEV
jgi:hypothetical protein